MHGRCWTNWVIAIGWQRSCNWGGPWLKELVSLRVKDMDRERGQVVIRGGEGDKDWVTLLPEQVRRALNEMWGHSDI